MIQLSIQELKKNLSAHLTRVEEGQPIVVTRHGRPIVKLTPAAAGPDVHVGKRFGKGSIGPGLGRSLGGRALAILEEDRRDRFDEWFPER